MIQRSGEAKRYHRDMGDIVIRKEDASRQALPADDERPWMRYAGFVESGDPNSSQSIDEIVYGAKD
jgi:hypothetical protein